MQRRCTLQNGGDQGSGIGLFVVDIGTVLDQQLDHVQVPSGTGKIEWFVSAALAMRK